MDFIVTVRTEIQTIIFTVKYCLIFSTNLASTFIFKIKTFMSKSNRVEQNSLIFIGQVIWKLVSDWICQTIILINNNRVIASWNDQISSRFVVLLELSSCHQEGFSNNNFEESKLMDLSIVYFFCEFLVTHALSNNELSRIFRRDFKLLLTLNLIDICLA